MQLINGPIEYRALDEILVDETRQRKNIAAPALAELKRSIETHGLLHPAVVTEKRLISGRRRMLAVAALHSEDKPVFFGDYPVPKGMMPVVEKANLDVATQREIELDENLKRVDLTWQEKVAALAELHNLRKAADPAQTERDTADEVAAATGHNAPYLQQSVQAAVLIQPFLDNPDVKRATSLQAARKIVIKNIEAEFAAKRPKLSSKTLKLIHGSLAYVLPTLGGPQFDCVIADPPYGIGADKFGSAAQMLHGYDDSETGARKIVGDILWGVRPLMKPDAHLYLFCDVDYFTQFREMAASAGWRTWRTPLIWHKPGEGHAPDPRRGPRRNYEFILFAWQGNRFMREVRSDVLTCAAEQDKLHGAQKPVALYCELASRSCLAGESVLDPCCGSGTVFAAAKMLNMTATGIEADERYHAVAAQRIADLG